MFDTWKKEVFMSTDATLTRPGTATYMGHPSGLFLLFFVEMWERFSYYGMRALLVFYMTKGFLNLNDKAAYAIYGAYTALVYATPFIGGMLADKLLGARRAVVLGGMLMAAGHLLMTFEDKTAFSVALALLICGNGFFKPNISTMVGAMYPAGSPSRDGGFTIFYMGINLGAAMSPLICGYIGETFGWHYGFGLATIGMLAGLMTFVVNHTIARVLIGLTAVLTAGSMFLFHMSDPLQLVVNVPVAIALLVAAFIAIAALAGGGLPDDVGRPPHPGRSIIAVYVGTAIAVPLAAILVLKSELAGWLLTIFSVIALGTLLFDTLRAEKVERERMFVVLTLTFFSMLFFAFFEQAGSSVSNFTDRNIDRTVGGVVLTQKDVGRKLEKLPVTSALLGRTVAGRKWKLKMVDIAQSVARTTVVEAPEDATNAEIQRAVNIAALKGVDDFCKSEAAGASKAESTEVKEEKKEPAKQEEPRKAAATNLNAQLQRAFLAKEMMPYLESVEVNEEMVGMKVDGREVKASMFQAANPIFIMIFGVPLALVWSFLATYRWEPNTAVKFALGLLQLGLGFGAFWLGTQSCTKYGIVAMEWLLLGYLLHTVGELCLSPVGLSMVTKLSPQRMVSTVMGGWFLASALANFLGGMIAALTGVGEEGVEAVFPLPIESVHVYGGVFAFMAIAGCVSALVLFILSPLLLKWMHGQEAAGGH